MLQWHVFFPHISPPLVIWHDRPNQRSSKVSHFWPTGHGLHICFSIYKTLHMQIYSIRIVMLCYNIIPRLDFMHMQITCKYNSKKNDEI